MHKNQFRSLFTFISVAVAALLFLQCATTSNSFVTPRKPQIEQGHNVIYPNQGKVTDLSLTDMLRTVSGIRITGAGEGTSIKIRNSSSILLSTEPLFVIDGIPVGNDFAYIYNAVDPIQVEKIRVIKDSTAAFYGSRGANGVIEITLKKRN